jgi:hypothetical protein
MRRRFSCKIVVEKRYDVKYNVLNGIAVAGFIAYMRIIYAI